MNFTSMNTAEIQQGLKAGDFSAREVAQASIDHIAKADESVHAYLEFTPEAALAAAELVDNALAADNFDELGPLAGVPVAFKDNMNMEGTHTTCSSHMLENYVSPYTATCVDRVLASGALPLGKLNMDEFAFGSSTETSYFGPTHNPWDLERVRVKPTYGVVSRYGVVAFGSSLDQVGPFARSVEDAALAMNALVRGGSDHMDCTSQSIATDFTANLEEGVKGMRIGIVPTFMEAEGLDAEVKERIEEAARKLEAAGAELVEVELPNAQAAMSAYYVLGPCEDFSNLARFDSVRYGYCVEGCKDLNEQYELSRAGGFGVEARRRIMLGSYLLSSGVYDKYYYPAQQVRTLITQDYMYAYHKVDCILAPVSPRTAFKFGEINDPTSMYLSDMFTISINIAGYGGMSVPVGLGVASGLPIGAQLIAPAFRDENMLRVAAELERCYGKAPIAPAFAKAGE